MRADEHHPALDGGLHRLEIGRQVCLGGTWRQNDLHCLSAGDAVIYDVRSHGYYDPKAKRIQGSKRLEPNAIHQIEEDIPAGKQVYLYCTCVGEATSARVVQELQAKGVRSAVIKGGFRSWRKAGLPVESVPAADLAAMPSFDR